MKNYIQQTFIRKHNNDVEKFLLRHRKDIEDLRDTYEQKLKETMIVIEQLQHTITKLKEKLQAAELDQEFMKKKLEYYLAEEWHEISDYIHEACKPDSPSTKSVESEM